MKSPWKSIHRLDPDASYLVVASTIPPRSRRSTARLFAGASSVRRQLATTDGIVGFSLLARPLRKQYATLSMWADETALAEFVASDPHRQLMTDLAAEMAPTRFARWHTTGNAGRPTWNDALARLADENHRGSPPRTPS